MICGFNLCTDITDLSHQLFSAEEERDKPFFASVVSLSTLGLDRRPMETLYFTQLSRGPLPTGSYSAREGCRTVCTSTLDFT